MEPNLQLSNLRTKLIVWTLLAIMPLVGMAVDLIAPSLPAIAHSLQIPDSMAKNAIAIYLLGYALGNFFLGFLTDSLGRRQLILIGLLGFLGASLLPVIFPNIVMLLLARLLQGVTIGGVAVICRAIFSDVLTAEKLIRLGPLTGAMWGLGPVLGPVIGGYLQFHVGWQAGFLFFALGALLCFIAVFFIVPETHFNRHPLKLATIRHNLWQVLSHRSFMAMVLLMGLVYSLIIVFNTQGPFLIQKVLQHNAIFFGHFALWMGVCFLSATFICRYLLKHYTFEKLLKVVIHLFFAVTVAGVLISYFMQQSLVITAMITAVMFFACGFIFPMSMGKGMSLFRHISGTASAVMYLINMCMSSLTALLVSFVTVHTIIPMMWVYFSLMGCAIIIYYQFLKND